MEKNSTTEIKRLARTDVAEFTGLVKVFEDVFEKENFICPPQSHLEKLLSKPSFLVLVAKKGDKVIGGLTVHILDQYYSIKPQAYIYDLAVLINHQRQGIGKQLITALNDYCREQGFEEVFVQAEKVDDHAIDFYRKTKPTIEDEVIHFTYVL